MGKGKYSVSSLSSSHKTISVKEKSMCLQSFKLSGCECFPIFQCLFSFTCYFSPRGVSDILQRGDGSCKSSVQAHNFQNGSRKITSPEDAGNGQQEQMKYKNYHVKEFLEILLRVLLEKTLYLFRGKLGFSVCYI